MGKLFGTDGARGVALTQLDCHTALKIGEAAACVLTAHAQNKNKKPTIVIGKDTRISGDILQAALIAGICSVGCDVILLGVVPTPAVAYLVKKYNADAGVMISASHNSFEYNGIKLFSCDGFKLDDSIEEEIENLVFNPEKIQHKEGAEAGRVFEKNDCDKDYIDHIVNSINGRFDGIKVALDCANGSASNFAKRIFESLGAECNDIYHQPDGININENCGSTHLENLKKYVKENGFDLGLAFDGDADRCLAVDENGEVVDGDQILAIFSSYMKEIGQLKNDTCVVTVMTNMGFFKFAEQNGINVQTTKVGDRYVLENMLENDFNLGGEQSGHIILKDYGNTGDGELTGAKLLEIIKHSGKKLSELANIMKIYPQVLEGVKIPAAFKGKWNTHKEITEVIEKCEKLLGDSGRILVRESGTEPLVRVMLEGLDTEIIQKYADEISEVVRKTAQQYN